jgi:hypothetical protein
MCESITTEYIKSKYQAELMKYPEYSEDIIALLKKHNCDFNSLSNDNTCQFWNELLFSFPNEAWNFKKLSENSSLNLDWLKLLPDAPWCWRTLTFNVNWTAAWVYAFPEKPWALNDFPNNKYFSSYLLCVFQYAHPELEVLDEEYTGPNWSDINYIVPLTLLNDNNKFWIGFNMGLLSQFKDIKITDSEKQGLLKVLEHKFELMKYTREVFTNIFKPLILTDLSGDNYELEGWLESDNIMKLVTETYPELGNIDLFWINPVTNEEQYASQCGNKKIKSDLLLFKEGANAMIIYKEEGANMIKNEPDSDYQAYQLWLDEY